MCYLIAKNIDEEGCVAFKTTHGKHLSTFKKSLIEKVGYDKIQLVTISRPSAYGEYEPYRFVESEAEFAYAVEHMQKDNISEWITEAGKIFPPVFNKGCLGDEKWCTSGANS